MRVAFFFAAFLVGSAASAQEAFVNRYHIYIQQGRQEFLGKTAQEMNTPEGQAILSAAAIYFGIPPEAVALATGAIASVTAEQRSDEEFSGLINSMEGYTICFAENVCDGVGCGTVGAGKHGIETHNDSTFNGTVMRVIPGQWDRDGLSWYLFAPIITSSDSRVDAWFDVGFVRAEGDWMNEFNCQPNGFHPFLARNNDTILDQACSPSEGVWCSN